MIKSFSLTTNIKIEIDSVNQDTWTNLLQTFDDATIYQTWSMETNKNVKKLNHVILKKDDEIVSICQIRIKKFYFLGTVTADVNYGPIWKKKNKNPDIMILYYMLTALRTEYVENQKLLLRIWPNEFENNSNEISSIFKNTNYILNTSAGQLKTLILNLSPNINELRLNLSRNWRSGLKKAEGLNLEIVKGSEIELFDISLLLQEQLLKRKKYIPGVDYFQFRKWQEILPKELKMIAFICKKDSNPIASLVCSAIGNTGIPLLAATGRDGLQFNGSYILQWHLINWLKENGFSYYDLGGIDPINNPNVYRFKHGLVGKSGKEMVFLGEFDAYNCLKSKLIYWMINLLRSIKNRIK
jgi:lipid II:glycine glycyltransferase (peptidoglycan interpeptide bridge formation enzyme)